MHISFFFRINAFLSSLLLHLDHKKNHAQPPKSTEYRMTVHLLFYIFQVLSVFLPVLIHLLKTCENVPGFKIYPYFHITLYKTLKRWNSALSHSLYHILYRRQINQCEEVSFCGFVMLFVLPPLTVVAQLACLCSRPCLCTFTVVRIFFNFRSYGQRSVKCGIGRR